MSEVVFWTDVALHVLLGGMDEKSILVAIALVLYSDLRISSNIVGMITAKYDAMIISPANLS